MIVCQAIEKNELQLTIVGMNMQGWAQKIILVQKRENNLALFGLADQLASALYPTVLGFLTIFKAVDMLGTVSAIKFPQISECSCE